MKFVDCNKIALSTVLLPGVGVLAETLTPVGVVAPGESYLVSDVVNAPTGALSQAQLGWSAPRPEVPEMVRYYSDR